MNVVATPVLPKQTYEGIAVKRASPSNALNSLTKISENKQAFGSVFNQLTTQQKVSETTGMKTDESMKSLGEVVSLLETDSLEGLHNSLQLNLPISELSGPLTIEKVAEFLELDVKDLKTTIEDLLGEELNSDNLWEMLGQIDQQAPVFTKSIMDSLAGVGKVTPQQAAAVVQLLKAIELAAPKTDLVLKQEVQVFSLKEMLSAMSSQMEKMVSNGQKDKPLHMMRNAQPIAFNKLTETATNATTTTTIAAEIKSSEAVNNQVVVKTTQTQENQQVFTGQVVTQVKTETVTMTLPTQKPAQSEALMKEFQTLLNRSQFGQAGGTTKMLIKMYPEHLGTIRVELIQKDGVMTARLLANTALGKEMLDSQLHQLKSAFANANVQVDRIDVTQALQDSNKNDKQQQFNQSFKQQQQQDAEQNEHEETPEQASFREFLMELEA